MSSDDSPDEIGDLPKIGRPATRALAAEGLTSLAAVAEIGQQRLLALHGVGPRAIRILSEEIDGRGMEWAATRSER